MKEIAGKKVILTEGEFLRREEANKRYLMKLETPYLLRSYLHEAGRYSGRGPDAEAFGGWEDLSCQLRGHFLGHWLSAAALHYQETEDVELKAKTEVILKELELCQKDNGGEWVCPIPEKYLYWIGKGRNIWAPQYNIHKLFMGLIDGAADIPGKSLTIFWIWKPAVCLRFGQTYMKLRVRKNIRF